MKIISVLGLLVILASAPLAANAQTATQVTIVSDPSVWYVSTPEGIAPSPEALIVYPELTTLPGPIPQHWNVTRLDPWTRARVIWLNGGASVVTWGTSRVLPNWHEYHTPFREMSNGKSYYTRHDLPMRHAMHAEFHMADRNDDGRITPNEHLEFFGEH